MCMNDEHMCERCGEEPASNLVEHTMYAEAVCGLCLKDEREHHEKENEKILYMEDYRAAM